MKETWTLLCFSVLLVRGLLVSAKVVTGYEYGEVTLPCTYSAKNGATTMCWGRDRCPSSKCTNRIIWTDGSSVTMKESDRYQLLGNIAEGNVSLTIRNLSKKDEGTYCCRVEIPGWFNDEKHEINVKVQKAPKTTQPALTTRPLGFTHDYKHPEYADITSRPFIAMTSGTLEGKQKMVQMEEEEEPVTGGESVNPLIPGVGVLLILIVSAVGLLFTWKYHQIKKNDQSRNTGERALEGLQKTPTPAEQNIYTIY